MTTNRTIGYPVGSAIGNFSGKDDSMLGGSGPSGKILRAFSALNQSTDDLNSWLLNITRASSVVVEEYNERLRSVGNNVPAFLGGRWDEAEQVWMFDDGAGVMLHPMAHINVNATVPPEDLLGPHAVDTVYVTNNIVRDTNGDLWRNVAPYTPEGDRVSDSVAPTFGATVTNKCQCYSFPPADSEQAPLTSGQNTIGKVYEIKARSLLDFTSIGSADNVVGTQFIATGQVTLTEDDSLAEIKWAIGTYADTALPTNIDGFVCSGDAAGKFEIVAADTEAESFFGHLPGWAGKIWQTDNSAGATFFLVNSNGQVTNTNDHNTSMFGKKLAGVGEFNVALLGAAVGAPFGATFSRENITDTPTSTTRTLQIASAAGVSGEFALPQLEENATMSSPVITANTGASTTKTFDDYVIDNNVYWMTANAMVKQVNATLPRLAHYEPWSAAAQMESGRNMAPAGHGVYYTNGAASTPELVDTLASLATGLTFSGQKAISDGTSNGWVYETTAQLLLANRKYRMTLIVGGTGANISPSITGAADITTPGTYVVEGVMSATTSNLVYIRPSFVGDVSISVVEIPRTSLVEPLTNSDGLYYEERVVNGGFDVDYGWDTSGTWAVGSGVAECTAGSTPYIRQLTVPISSGKKYRLSFSLIDMVGGSIRPTASGLVGAYRSVDDTYVEEFTAINDTSGVMFTGVNFVGKIKNVSLYEIDADGNPVNVLDGGRRVAQTNLLTYSEQFDNAAWVKTNITATPNSTAAPNGETTADTLTTAAIASQFSAFQAPSPNRSAGWYMGSVFLKAGTEQYAWVQLATGDATLERRTFVIDLSTGEITDQQGGTAPYNDGIGFCVVSPSGDGWYRAQVVEYNDTAGTVPIYLIVGICDSATPAAYTTAAYPSADYTGGAKNIYAWGGMVHEGMGQSDRPAFEYIKTEAAPVTEQPHTNIQWNVGGLYQDQIGLLVEPAGTNKCECHSFPPADAEQAALTSGQNVVGKVYEIKAQSILDFTTIGAANNNVGTQFLATGQLTLTADDSLAEIKWAIGTYATTALPTNIPGFTCSGDAAGKLEIVAADAEAEAKFGQLPGWASKMWRINNSSGASNFLSLSDGATVNANTHTVSAYGDSSGAGVYLEGGVAGQLFSDTLGRANYQDARAAARFGFYAVAGGTSNVAIPHLEESAYVSSPILTTGASATRAACVVTFDNGIAANDMTILADIIPLGTLSVSPTFISNYTDANNQAFVFSGSTGALAFRKYIGGISHQALTGAGAFSLDVLARIATIQDSVAGMSVFADGTKGATTSSNIEDIPLANTSYLGKASGSSVYYRAIIKNLFGIFATETDANMQTITGYDQ